MGISTIALTGTTGRVGGQVARLLTDTGVPVRLLARTPVKVPALPGADVVEARYEDSAETRSALQGIEVLLMVSASESADRLEQHRGLIRSAAAAGVRHVVYTSFMGAAADATFTLARDHGATEDMLRDSGMDWTFLRNNFYIDIFPEFASGGVLAGPAGQGRVAAVARADVAHVAAVVLQHPQEYRGSVLELTGREAVTLTEMAALITQATGRPTRYHEETLEEAYASRAVYGAADWQVEAWVSTYTEIASGNLSRVTSDVERVTGHPPLGIVDTLRSL